MQPLFHLALVIYSRISKFSIFRFFPVFPFPRWGRHLPVSIARLALLQISPSRAEDIIKLRAVYNLRRGSQFTSNFTFILFINSTGTPVVTRD